MTVNRTSLQASEIQHHYDRIRADNRHNEILTQDRHIKERLKDNEEKRIEANQRMNRAGQNIDKLA